ncbi:hypothetical protein GQ53DRAFT_808064 [Thozetella sp. PMI_491]|nr:hypothetical protein GQ53DRAFT_808064 [Thozetella sp. PMI_491]
MKTFFAFAAAIAGVAATGLPDGCHGDNCFNQVGATRFGQATYLARGSECATSLAVTVTPEPSTTTSTVTVAPTVPVWASGCVNYGAFSTACTCNGFSALTVTAPTPIVTVTVTSTLTA